MERAEQLAKRLREVILNGTWIANTNYQHQLTDLNWELATTMVASCNTIALLAQHIHYYIKGVMNVLQGGTLDIKDQYSFDFLPLTSQNEWDNFLTIFLKDAEKFASLIEQMPNEKLEEVFVTEKYGNYQRNIDGIIEHSYYHLGQIVLLKKILLAGG
jgi:hypothetical protein